MNRSMLISMLLAVTGLSACDPSLKTSNSTGQGAVPATSSTEGVANDRPSALDQRKAPFTADEVPPQMKLSYPLPQTRVLP